MYIGIDIGGTKCAVVKGTVIDDRIKIESKVKFPTPDKDEALSRIFSEVERLMPCNAIGISCGGPLDEERGVIMSPPNLPGWDSVPITKLLTERFGVPAYLLNDANACAVAEWKFGAGRGAENMVFLTFGTGMGAGLILNGRLYSGCCGMAGEVGHIRLSHDGPEGYATKSNKIKVGHIINVFSSVMCPIFLYQSMRNYALLTYVFFSLSHTSLLSNTLLSHKKS